MEWRCSSAHSDEDPTPADKPKFVVKSAHINAQTGVTLHCNKFALIHGTHLCFCISHNPNDVSRPKEIVHLQHRLVDCIQAKSGQAGAPGEIAQASAGGDSVTFSAYITGAICGGDPTIYAWRRQVLWDPCHGEKRRDASKSTRQGSVSHLYGVRVATNYDRTRDKTLAATPLCTWSRRP